MLQIEALRDAAELDVQIAANQLERDFLAGVARGEIDFAETAPADATLDRVALERPRAAGIGKLDRGDPRSLRFVKLGRLQIHGRFSRSF